MSEQFRIFRRASGVWYIEEKANKHQESRRTRDASEAKRLLQARNEAQRLPTINLQIARAYVAAADPAMVTRNWKDVVEAIASQKQGETRRRWLVSSKDKALPGPSEPESVVTLNGLPRRLWGTIQQLFMRRMQKKLRFGSPHSKNWERQMQEKVLDLNFSAHEFLRTSP